MFRDDWKGVAGIAEAWSMVRAGWQRSETVEQKRRFLEFCANGAVRDKPQTPLIHFAFC